MSRYIDADALIEKLKQHHDFFVKAWGGFREMPIQDKARCDELSNSIAEIFNAPSIDIVRCKECRWWNYEMSALKVGADDGQKTSGKRKGVSE